MLIEQFGVEHFERKSKEKEEKFFKILMAWDLEYFNFWGYYLYYLLMLWNDSVLQTLSKISLQNIALEGNVQKFCKVSCKVQLNFFKEVETIIVIRRRKCKFFLFQHIFSFKKSSGTFLGIFPINWDWTRRRYHYSYNSINTLHATYVYQMHWYERGIF